MRSSSSTPTDSPTESSSLSTGFLIGRVKTWRRTSARFDSSIYERTCVAPSTGALSAFGSLTFRRLVIESS